MYSFLGEVLAFALPQFLVSLANAIRRYVFSKRFGIDGYDIVLGSEVRRFLDKEYGQENWSWQVKLIGFNKEKAVFEVRYDDCGGWAGVVSAAPHRPPEERFEIIHREEREWPPSDW